MHVAVRPNAARLRDPDDGDLALGDGKGVCLHWSLRNSGQPARGLPVAGPLQMLRDAVHCLPPDFAVAMIDSALHERVIRHEDLDALRADLPINLARVVLDADGRCESGVESVARYRLQRAGLRVEVQVPIPRVGRVDLLVEGRLIVELDGRAWHDDEQAFARDRRRGAAATIGRYRTERFDYRQVFFEWLSVEAAILAALAA